MKKFLIWLVAIMMLLTACGETVEEITSQIEESSQAEPEGEPKYTLVSVGKPYNAISPANENYPDIYNQQLTDGVKAPDFGTHYTDARTVGFSGGCTIVIDLGEDGKRLSRVTVRSLEMDTDGVGLASSLRVYGSNDGKRFKSVGMGGFVSQGNNKMVESSFNFKTPTDYRFIKVSVTNRSGFHFVFLDEIEIFADVDEKPKADTVSISYQNENIDRNAWKALSTGIECNPRDVINAAQNLKYTFENAGFDTRAPKNDKFLTDGQRTGRYFGEDVWVGISSDGEKAPAIKFDLKKVYENLYSFRVHALGVGTDVNFPDYIDVYGSKDGKEYTLLGRMYAPVECENYAYTLLLPEYVSARFIKFEFPKDKANYWVEEIEINQGYNDGYENTIYPDLTFPTVTEDIYWDKAEPDYSKKQNLLIGANQQVSATYYDGKEMLPEHHVENSPYNFAPLADGKRARNTECYNGDYFFSVATTGYSNCLDFFYDLGAISTINALNVHLLEYKSIGITRPSFINVYLSNDGDNWYSVGEYTMPLDTEFNLQGTQLSFEFPLETAYAARFVRFRVEEPKNPRFVFIDELEAIGTKKVAKSVKNITESGIEPVKFYTNTEREEYASTENTTVNSQHQVLYIPDYGDESTLLPLVAHLDEEGNITDTMFDGFICWGAMSYPSGIKAYQPSYYQDWQHLYEITFNGVNGLDRLNEVVGQVKDALNIPDYTVKVYISTLTIHESVTDFGCDLDGDGVNENLSLEADRKKVIEWYLKLYTDEFAKRGYEHIVLDGVNYIDESVHLEVDNSYLLKEIGESVNAAGLNYIWIPYYNANRFYLGGDLGFDTVCMQINYVFTNDAPEWQISSSAEMTKKLGMSIEMEHTFQCLGDKIYARQFMKYLKAAVEYGFADGILMYYMDRDNFSVMGYSDDPLMRMQYESLYALIHGKLEITPEKKDDISVTAKKDTILTSTLNPETALELYTLVTPPKHGTVSLTNEGEFVYYPEKGYTGSDSFTYTYNEYLGESEPCTVNITIE